MNPWTFSTDDTREEAIAYADSELDPGERYYVGEMRPPVPLADALPDEFWSYEAEGMIESASEVSADHEDYQFDIRSVRDYLSDLPPETVAKLAGKLKAAFGEWIRENDLHPTWFCIAKSEEREVPKVEEDAK